MIYTEILTNPILIDEACALLYKMHVEHTKWIFSADNPSKIRVETSQISGEKILVDRFSKNAVWFGAFDKGKLIGCTRLCHVDKNNLLEVEGYESSKVIQSFLPKDKSTVVESTRTVVSEKYSGSGVSKLLLLAQLRYCEVNQYSLCATVSHSYLKLLLARIEFPLKMEHAFKYEPQDPSSVNFYFADYAKSEIKHVIELLVLESTKSNKDKIFDALNIVAPIIPVPLYWHDKDGKVLGLNEHCLSAMGGSRENIIGKSPYNFYPREIAETILNHHEKVMRSGEILTQDECIRDITTGQIKHFRNIKGPLYDDNGMVIGLIGSAFEITSEKQNEELQAQLKAQEVFKKCIDHIQTSLQTFRINAINERVDIKSTIKDKEKLIQLTNREEQVLYLLSLGKNPKKIADILSRLDKKRVTPATVNSIINKSLYSKFEVYSVEQLVEKATLLNMVPFLHESFLDLTD